MYGKIFNVPTTINEENKEVLAIKEIVEKCYRTTPKYERWLELYLDAQNKCGLGTYQNQTLSACLAYGYNPKERKQYLAAAVIGHKNINKYKHLAAAYYESKGITYGKMLDIFFEIMIKRKDVNMWYTIMSDMGYPTPKYVNVTNLSPQNSAYQLVMDQQLKWQNIP